MLKCLQLGLRIRAQQVAAIVEELVFGHRVGSDEALHAFSDPVHSAGFSKVFNLDRGMRR